MKVVSEHEFEEKIREYYRHAPLYLPNANFRWKHYRVVLCDGTFVKIKDRITDIQKLRNMLVMYAPYKCYTSVAYFLNPTIVGRQDRDMARVLWTDLVVDIDFEGDDWLERAKQETKKVYAFFTDRGFAPEILFSGSKGFHVRIMEWDKKYAQQEEKMLNLRKQIKDEMVFAGLNIDEPVLVDLRRITKTPLTIDGSSGYLCEFVDIDKIDEFQPKKIIDAEMERPLYLTKVIENLNDRYEGRKEMRSETPCRIVKGKVGD